MASQSRDKTSQVVDGLDALVQAGQMAEVEELLTTIIESEPAQDESAQERETRSYATGMRDGIALGRQLSR